MNRENAKVLHGVQMLVLMNINRPRPMSPVGSSERLDLRLSRHAMHSDNVPSPQIEIIRLEDPETI